MSTNNAAGLTWQTIALVLGAAGASSGGTYVAGRATRPAAGELEERVRDLETTQHRAEVAQAGRDAHLDEQLAALHADLAAIHQLLAAKR